MSIDYQNKADAKVAEEVIQDIVQSEKTTEDYTIFTSSQYEMENMFNDSYGSLFFLGLFLGLLFLMAAILIMYYKQLIRGDKFKLVSRIESE